MKRKAAGKIKAKPNRKAARKSAANTTIAKKTAKAGAKPKRPKSAPLAAADAGALDGLVAAGAQALGIALDPSWQAGVKFNLRLILIHAAKVDGFPLPDDTEPAPVFHA
ncbi:MAG TPA: DUF4089 domain-containing protein [Xanthobacteraceae bacterium]|nr:DUF4089 domain-containing protein [Xanthobacteraceae bacterium]